MTIVRSQLVTVIVLANVLLRWFAYYDDAYTGVVILVLSVVAAVLVSAGAAIGGELVYDYGFNVETAGDSPVWHKSEVDVLPGQPEPVAPTAASPEPEPAAPPPK